MIGYVTTDGAGSTKGALVFGTRDVTTASAPTERMRITSDGKLKLNSTSAGGTNLEMYLIENDGLYINSNEGATGRTIYFQTGGTTRFTIGSTGLLYSPPTYASTTGNAANVYIFAGGDFGRSTSSIKYKKNVINYEKGLAELMTLRPVSYESVNEREVGMQFAGLIAEEIEEAGFTEFVQYAEDGTPDAISYGNMIALLTKAIQELSAKVSALEAK
jgi:hypothetical protein